METPGCLFYNPPIYNTDRTNQPLEFLNVNNCQMHKIFQALSYNIRWIARQQIHTLCWFRDRHSLVRKQAGIKVGRRSVKTHKKRERYRPANRQTTELKHAVIHNLLKRCPSDLLPPIEQRQTFSVWEGGKEGGRVGGWRRCLLIGVLIGRLSPMGSMCMRPPLDGNSLFGQLLTGANIHT